MMLRDKKQNKGKAALAATAILAAITSCGKEARSLPDAGPRKPIPALDAGRSGDSGTDIFFCQKAPSRELNCQEPLTDVLSKGGVMGVAGFYVQLEDVDFDPNGVPSVDVNLLDGICSPFSGIVETEGDTRVIELISGPKFTISSPLADAQGAHIRIHKADCLRSCTIIETGSRLLGMGDSISLDGGKTSVQLEEIIAGEATVALKDGGNIVQWRLHISEGRTKTADFWTKKVNVTVGGLDAQQADIRADFESCSF